MTIDILSDLHVDFYFRGEPTPKAIEKLYTPLFIDPKSHTTADILIVAGDIGHDNDQNLYILQKIHELYGYRQIICVLGNHDYYLLSELEQIAYRNASLNRVQEMREMINAQEGMVCLDGEIIEIDGIKIGGCDSWYDGQYIKHHFKNREGQTHNDTVIDDYWASLMNDAKKIRTFNWQAYAQKERTKIEQIYREVDIMITHVNPSILKEHISERFREDASTGFFSFNGNRFLEEGNMKYWIFGHTHEPIEYDYHGVKCICNPMGYPGENNRGKGIKNKRIAIVK